ncbi:gamma-glutamylcyclotransferase [Meridianimarinicoccus aquatilis]|uniref:glutathione-specific gamma-glutamylcyclotransferase n=1 Tax=Meridianimarinicoccus aquatilis TaxID=2552766 RepID=A0A4R6B1P6_9RHOB|nr:gamma-glutamylcyclotransferase [Fluviibacterium aquatile]TDL91081.1 gamma-glutamylcyclotransferase [Fluviibacterium aquatile]
MAQNDPALWIFGYGSLIWNPGFPYVDRVIGELPGYARSFCMRSIHHRGTVEDPGLVLALDPHPGTRCSGVAFGVAEAEAESTLDALRERELVSSAYLEKMLPLELSDGRRVKAVTYVVDPDHVQYCGGLDLEEQARIIATAIGGRGPNCEYLFNTASHLRELGLADADLDWLATRVAELV